VATMTATAILMTRPPSRTLHRQSRFDEASDRRVHVRA
jgi:hypothetical protein